MIINTDDSLLILGGASAERSSSGLLEWESVNDAMEALAMMNHYQMKNPSECWTVACQMNVIILIATLTCCLCFCFPALDGPYPYTLKLCFSTAQHANWKRPSAQAQHHHNFTVPVHRSSCVQSISNVFLLSEPQRTLRISLAELLKSCFYRREERWNAFVPFSFSFFLFFVNVFLFLLLSIIDC